MKRIVIHVSGKVQGVYYRASTKAMADQLGIHGFVRNENDGTVYVEAEGSDQPLSQFVAWCKEGPAHANVLKCEVREIKPNGTNGFQITR